MELTTSERTFKLPDGTAFLKVFQPSVSHGGWPGNPRTIRVWKRHHSGNPAIVRMEDDEIIRFEAELGEIADVVFIQHPTLGKVVLG